MPRRFGLHLLVLPLPADPSVSVPGLAFISATSSRVLAAFTDGWTTSTSGTVPMTVMGVIDAQRFVGLGMPRRACSDEGERGGRDPPARRRKRAVHGLSPMGGHERRVSGSAP